MTNVNITQISSREFNQDVGGAKRAAEGGPVFVTDRGNPRHVLLTYDQYLHLRGEKRSLNDALSSPGLSDIEFDPPRSEVVFRPTEFD